MWVVGTSGGWDTGSITMGRSVPTDRVRAWSTLQVVSWIPSIGELGSFLLPASFAPHSVHIFHEHEFLGAAKGQKGLVP